MKNIFIKTWNKVPAIIKGILIGLTVQVIGVMPLFFLIQKNIEFLPTIPWALAIGLIYTWLFWSFVSGKGKPFPTSASRQRFSRSNNIKPNVKKWAYISGIPFSITLIAFGLVGYFLTEVPLHQVQLLSALKSIPMLTGISLIFIAALITGFVEETAWRWYAQKIIEERHSVFISISVVAIVFTIIHFLPLPVWPLFILGSLGWGYLAYFSNSIIPGIIFHTIIDFVGFLWGMQNIEKLEAILKHNIFIDGVNQQFIIIASVALTFAIITVFSFKRLKLEMAQ
ncbi:MAG: hypothetical protein DRI75_13315 [Bacteroidetes bacterium]|nr:MAG: hypothetical protein DRI75_13315 [Bacteroidota bacterium]